MLFLSKVSYLPDKRQIVAEFSRKDHRLSKRYSFFPRINVRVKNADVLKEVLSVYDSKRYTLKAGVNDEYLVECATFSDLKKISSLLRDSLGVGSLIIEPERQFLLMNAWSYYDAFVFRKNGTMEKSEDLFIVPEIKLHFLTECLPAELSNLAIINTKTAEELLERVVLSNALRVPLQFVPKTAALKAELFLENAFFANSFPLASGVTKKNFPSEKSKPRGFFTDLVEFDFSPLWTAICTFPYFNLGPDTINCSCCKPNNYNSANILPNSMINVEFQADGVYFESLINDWASQFHEQNSHKDERTRHRQEWHLNSFPAGPFFRSQQQQVPFADYRLLSEQNKAVATPENHELLWFCKNKESFLSVEINYLNRKIELLGEAISKQEKKSTFKHNLAAYSELSKNANYLYRVNYLSQLLDLQHALTVHLTSPNSKFFSQKLSDAISALKQEMLNRFKDFSRSKGAKPIHSDSSRVFIDTSTALALAKAFSERYSLPEPKIVRKWRAIAFN